jgi:hypothetical protein
VQVSSGEPDACQLVRRERIRGKGLTIPLVWLAEADEAAEAWLERALLRADPVALATKVVVPKVVVKVEEPLTPVETIADVTVLSGMVVAPATPPTPEIVVSPVTVEVAVPLVMVDV